MFTGIIQSVGHIKSMTRMSGDYRIVLDTAKLDMSDVHLGDSIAVNGVCLTVIDHAGQSFSADVSNETISHTALAQLKTGSRVNLEKALSLQDRLGGHLVSGHVDGLGEIISISKDARSVRFKIKPDPAITKYIAKKGSITVDGISLTVNTVGHDGFELNIVPHTIQETIMSDYQAGHKVNLEVDVIARYVEQLLLGGAEPAAKGSALTEQFLAQHGFTR